MKPRDGVVFNRVGEELVLLDLNRGVYYGLDPIGARIWELLSEGLDENTIVSRLTDEYEVGQEELRGDLAKLMGELRECGLVL